MSRFFIVLGLCACSFFHLSAQEILVRERGGNKGHWIKLRKISAIGTLDGRVYEGKAQRSGSKLLAASQIIDMSEVGFIEAKKFRPEKVAAFPFKAVGIASCVVGSLVLMAIAENRDEDNDLEAAVGAGSIVTGLGLFFVGEKIAPSVKEVKVFHIKDWEFSWRK